MYLQILGLFYCRLPCFTLELGACEPALFVVSGVRQEVPLGWDEWKQSRRNPTSLGRDQSGTEAGSVTSPRNAALHGHTLRVPCLHPLGKHWCFEHLLFAVWTWSQARMGISALVLHFW